MSADVTAAVPAAIGITAVPSFMVELAAADPELLTAAWAVTRHWIDSEFFEGAGVLAGTALEEVADAIPPGIDHVRYGAFSGADLPGADRAVEAWFQRAPRELILAMAWHGAISDDDFGVDTRLTARPHLPGSARFALDLPRPPDDSQELAVAAASGLQVPAAVSDIVPLTAWPLYLDVAVSDFAEQVGGDGYATAIDRVTVRAHEIAASLAPPMLRLAGASGPGAQIIEAAAAAGPASLVAVAFLRLGLPRVARIPRVA